jgi:hypothetical protein
MKKVVLILTAAVFSTAFIACKNDKNSQTLTHDQDSEVLVDESSTNIAMADGSELNSDAETEFLYVTAPSGLSLREYGNLQSEKLGRMPYGTKVKVITREKNPTMNIGGIKGGMNEVEFNHKKGFAFNGYLSKYFPPERDISPKGYVSELNQLFPEVIFTEATGGSVTKPTLTETISLPNGQWHEAFYMAQRLFDFPKEFNFPNPKGPSNETLKDGKPKKGVWISQLEITRTDNELEKIAYVYGSQKFDSRVTIVKEGDLIKISRKETVK